MKGSDRDLGALFDASVASDLSLAGVGMACLSPHDYNQMTEALCVVW